MKKHFLTLITITSFTTLSLAQIGVNSDNSAPHPSAQLDIKSTDKGLLIPRLTTLERNAIQSPEIGLMVFDKDLQEIFIYNSDGWKQGTLSKLPLILSSGNFNNIFKVINTKSDSYPNGSTAAEFINNDILGTAISAKSSGNLPTIDARNSSGTAIYGESSGFGTGGIFSSVSGAAIQSNSQSNNAIIGSNNSNTVPTAKFINSGNGPALELNSGLKIVTTKPTGIEVHYSSIGGSLALDAGISSQQTGFSGSAIFASSEGISPTINVRANGPSSPAIYALSTNSNGGYFSSNNGIGLFGSAENNHALYVSNTSSSNATAKITNLVGGPAMELNNQLKIITTVNSYPAIYASTSGIWPTLRIIGEGSGSGIYSTTTYSDAGHFESTTGRALFGKAENNIAIIGSNNSLSSPTVKINNSATGGVALEINGSVKINGTVLINSFQYPIFENNWTSLYGEYAAFNFYKSSENRVYLNGTVTGGNNSKIFTLPTGFRPVGKAAYLVPIGDTDRGKIEIRQNGDVVLVHGTFSTVSLDGISFFTN